MSEWVTFDGSLPPALGDVERLLTSRHGAAGPVGDADGSSPVVLAVSEEDSGRRAIDWLNGLSVESDVNVVVVVSDGYVGTDSSDRAVPTLGAAAVSAVRSLAATRGTRVRANVVAVPESMFGEPGEHRGPLAHVTDETDVAEAISFLLDPENGYLSGQILFVDGGRHLFSSMTA